MKASASSGIASLMLGILMLTLVACTSGQALPGGSSEVRLTQGNESATVGMTGVLRVELVGNEGTGYLWRLAANDPSKLELKGTPSVTPLDPGIRGGRTITSFEFHPLVPGVSQLVFEYARPWLTDEPPGRRAEVEVTVTGGGA